MVNGKAKLLREDCCDGLGDCLPACPTGAISFEEREAMGYDEKAVAMAKAGHGGGCPGSTPRMMPRASDEAGPVADTASELRQWPVQIKLVPAAAPYFQGANLLIAADCAAYARAAFHTEFIRGKVALIGCPKLDGVDYSEKLTEIIRENDIQSVTAVRMEVPCCGGIEQAAAKAVKNSGKFIPWHIVTLTVGGDIQVSKRAGNGGKDDGVNGVGKT
jgi:ferredoxin